MISKSILCLFIINILKLGLKRKTLLLINYDLEFQQQKKFNFPILKFSNLFFIKNNKQRNKYLLRFLKHRM